MIKNIIVFIVNVSTKGKDITDVNLSTSSQSGLQLRNQNNEIKPIIPPDTGASFSFSQTSLKPQIDSSIKDRSEVGFSETGFSATTEQKFGEIPKRISAANLPESQVRGYIPYWLFKTIYI